MSVNKEVKKVTTNTLQKMKAAGEKISMLTAYDYSFAKIIDGAGIDVILVGDSATNVMAGHETTLPDHTGPDDLSCIIGDPRDRPLPGGCRSSFRLLPVQFRYRTGFSHPDHEGNRRPCH